MEHRWGRRSAANVAVTLHSGAGSAVRGRIVNVSLSGALVSTDVRLPAFTQLIVELESPRPSDSPVEAISAFVVRDSPRGVALEWTEFSPPAIAALLRRPAAKLSRDAEPQTNQNCRPRSHSMDGMRLQRPGR